MFIWSETYKLVVYIPPDVKNSEKLSLCIWLVPNAEGEEI